MKPLAQYTDALEFATTGDLPSLLTTLLSWKKMDLYKTQAHHVQLRIQTYLIYSERNKSEEMKFYDATFNLVCRRSISKLVVSWTVH